MDELDAKLGAFGAVLEAWKTGVHDTDVVEVGPEGGGGGEVFSGDEFDEVILYTKKTPN